MAGSFLLVWIIAVLCLLFQALTKASVGREIDAQFSNLDRQEQVRTEIFHQKAKRLHASYLRPYLWSSFLMFFGTLALVWTRASFVPNGSAFLVALVVYGGLVSILEQVRYTPRRKQLRQEMAIWLANNRDEYETIKHINMMVPLFDTLPDITIETLAKI